jgi:hypothetical protein
MIKHIPKQACRKPSIVRLVDLFRAVMVTKATEIIRREIIYG